MIQADATGKHGVSLKSLTLGEDVGAKQKKAVYAVTVETLKYYTVLAGVVEGVKTTKAPRIRSSVVCRCRRRACWPESCC